MQRLYDSGIYTGFALVVEMIERGDHFNQQQLADHLRGIYQKQTDERLNLVISHASAMYSVLNLPKNAEKGSWQGICCYELLKAFRREVEEFEAALWGLISRVDPGPEYLKRVRSEGSDVSAFVAMITNNCERILDEN